ncbi:MAG TPA: hypothetical protein VL371_07665 [Gemmataceae bacterium]|jgi:hypothetical protein|nr:hypothetical protein [Gemmataceae bacterium]
MLKRTVATLVAVLAAGIPDVPARTDDKVPGDHEVAAWVRQRVQDWQPTAADRPFDEIGWAKDIRTAERLARDNDRPVFLFTHDGHMAVGRC